MPKFRIWKHIHSHTFKKHTIRFSYMNCFFPSVSLSLSLSLVVVVPIGIVIVVGSHHSIHTYAIIFSLLCDSIHFLFLYWIVLVLVVLVALVLPLLLGAVVPLLCTAQHRPLSMCAYICPCLFIFLYGLLSIQFQFFFRSIPYVNV